MARIPKEITDFMEKFGVLSDELWEVRAGAWAIKHKALERLAVENKVSFSLPTIVEVNLEKKLAAMTVVGTMGERSEWSTGESAPYNTKPGYPMAMAEKRAKDRVILKLLQAHGTLYSEDEFDGEKRKNPHVTEPTDIVPDVEYDEQGQPVDNIPNGDPGIDQLPKAKARADFETAQKEMRNTVTIQQLQTWGERNANRVASFPNDWQAIFRGLYIEHRNSLRNGKAA
jgi:hypothetical protein